MAAQQVYSQSFFDQGISVFYQCFKEPAAEIFTKHLQSHPKDFHCWMYRGLSYEFLGDESKAVHDYSQAEVLARTNNLPCEVMIVQGCKLRAQHNTEKAMATFERATKDYPHKAIGWHFYGSDRYNHGLRDDVTIAALRKAIELNYRFSGITSFFLGSLLSLQGNHVESLHHLRNGIKINPTCTINYIALGDVLVKTGCDEEAEQHYWKAIELNDTQVEANRGLAKIYAHRGDSDRATQHAAIYIEAKHSKRSSASESSGGHGGSSNGGGSRAMEGGSGGGGGGGGGGGSGDKVGENWAKTKKVATHKGKHRGIIYYRRELEGEYVWISLDRAHHAGAAFKVWKETRNQIYFDSSYDENLERMSDKHESNEGEWIQKCDMKIEPNYK